jgi:hypothetical protein
MKVRGTALALFGMVVAALVLVASPAGAGSPASVDLRLVWSFSTDSSRGLEATPLDKIQNYICARAKDEVVRVR